VKVTVKMVAVRTHASTGCVGMDGTRQVPVVGPLPCSLPKLKNFFEVNERFSLTTLPG
jgi:hypothetical protein